MSNIRNTYFDEFNIDLRTGNTTVEKLNTLRTDNDKFLIRGDIVTKSIHSQDDSIIDALATQKNAVEDLYRICNDNEILKNPIRDLVAEIEKARLVIESVLEK